MHALAKDCARDEPKQRAGGKRDEEDHYEEKIRGVFWHFGNGAWNSGYTGGSGAESDGGKWTERRNRDERNNCDGASRRESGRSGPAGRRPRRTPP